MHDIAIIGAGRIGRIHSVNAISEPRLAVKYIVDPVAKAANELAAATGASVASLDEILADPAVAGVVVASSTDTHLQFSAAAIEAGKAVFCEKPIDLDLKTARSAASTLDSGGARLFLGFNRRFDHNFLQLRERIQSGEMGALETLHIISHDPSPPPIDYVRLSGGMFKDMTIHDFDMARWLLGDEPVEVYAAATAVVDPAIGEAGDVDTAKTLLRTSSGRICVISNSRRSGYGYDQRIEAYCAKGLLRAGNVLSSTVETWSEDGPRSDALQNFFLDRYAGAYRSEMAHFADILDGATPLVGYRDGIAALAIAEAAMESHLESRAVRIRY
ncbi:MAG TPA: inositol 2-dehydrogenase [Sphingomicrobium sp.]|nr:inositol 2-dehydrogenase [Sphingomicrobium sp.]